MGTSDVWKYTRLSVGSRCSCVREASSRSANANAGLTLTTVPATTGRLTWGRVKGTALSGKCRCRLTEWASSDRMGTV